MYIHINSYFKIYIKRIIKSVNHYSYIQQDHSTLNLCLHNSFALECLSFLKFINNHRAYYFIENLECYASAFQNLIYSFRVKCIKNALKKKKIVHSFIFIPICYYIFLTHELVLFIHILVRSVLILLAITCSWVRPMSRSASYFKRVFKLSYSYDNLQNNWYLSILIFGYFVLKVFSKIKVNKNCADNERASLQKYNYILLYFVSNTKLLVDVDGQIKYIIILGIKHVVVGKDL